MKKTILLLVLLLATVSARAQDYSWAFGVRGGGNDSGVTLKHILSDGNAMELTCTYQYPRDRMVRATVLSALYEWNQPVFNDGFFLYYGFGAHVGGATMAKDGNYYGSLALGAVGVVGLEYKLYSAPIAFSLDYRPFLNLLPQPNLFFGNAGLGIKVCF